MAAWRLMVCPICGAEFHGDLHRSACSPTCRTALRRMHRQPEAKRRDRDRWFRLFGREAAAARLGVA